MFSTRLKPSHSASSAAFRLAALLSAAAIAGTACSATGTGDSQEAAAAAETPSRPAPQAAASTIATVPGGEVSTLAGPFVGGASSISIDVGGNLYVGSWSDRVYKILPDGGSEVFADGLEGTTGNALDAQGNLYQANFFNNSISKIRPDGAHETLSDQGLANPVDVALYEGSLLVSNCESNQVTRTSMDGETTTFAESNLFNCPNGITLASDGNIYVANFWDPRLLKITPAGDVSEFVTVPQDRNMIASVGDHIYMTSPVGKRVFRVSITTGEVALVAGTGEAEERDGAALEAAFTNPNGIAVSPDEAYLVISNVVAEEPAPGRFNVRRITLSPVAQ